MIFLLSLSLSAALSLSFFLISWLKWSCLCSITKWSFFTWEKQFKTSLDWEVKLVWYPFPAYAVLKRVSLIEWLNDWGWISSAVRAPSTASSLIFWKKIIQNNRDIADLLQLFNSNNVVARHVCSTGEFDNLVKNVPTLDSQNVTSRWPLVQLEIIVQWYYQPSILNPDSNLGHLWQVKLIHVTSKWTKIVTLSKLKF